jgi:hypothetical protein
MFKRFSVNYALFSMAVDSLLTVTALALTDALSVVWLRIVWPENWFYSQGEFIPPPLWPGRRLCLCLGLRSQAQLQGCR